MPKRGSCLTLWSSCVKATGGPRLTFWSKLWSKLWFELLVKAVFKFEALVNHSGVEAQRSFGSVSNCFKFVSHISLCILRSVASVTSFRRC